MSRCFAYENFKFGYPYLVDQIESWEEIGQFEIKLKLKSGETAIYEDIYRTCRTVPEDPNLMTEEECKREFKVRLRNVMRKRGMTQETLAMVTGIPQSQISGYTRGKHIPNFYVADKLARALECSLDEFRYL